MGWKQSWLSLLTVLILVLAACAPAAPATPTPTVKPQPVQPSPTLAPAVSGIPTPTTRPQPVQPSPTSVQATPTTVQPRYGGVLVGSEASSPPHFDMHQQTPLVALAPLTPNYSLLVYRDPTAWDQVVPDLAERWDVSGDGLTYTFYLRKGVLWHDGKPFISADVVASLGRIVSPPSGVLSAWKELLASVAKVEAKDDYSVVVTLKYPQASLLGNLSFDPMHIYPKHILDAKGDMKKDVVGTGPFKLKAFTQGVSFESVKNPEYYVKGRPYLDGIKYIVIRDDVTRAAAFRTGQVLFGAPASGSVDPQYWKELQGVGLTIAPRVLPWSNNVWMNLERAPWNDLRVRKAVYLALDRQATIAIPASGVGRVGWFMTPDSPWAISEAELLKKPGYRQPKDQDLSEAKRLLAQAGFPTGFSTKLMVRSETGEVTLAEFVQDQLLKIGIKSSIDLQETGAFREKLSKGEYDASQYTSAVSLTDPDGWLGPQYVTKGGQNFGRYSNPKFDDLYLKQSQELDATKRIAIVRDMQQLLEDDVAEVVLYYTVQAWIWPPKVKGYLPPPAQKMGLKFEHVWLSQ